MSATATRARTARAGGARGLAFEALADLRADFSGLLYVAESARAALDEAGGELGALRPATRRLLTGQLDDACRRYRALAEELVALGRAARGASSPALVDELAAEKARLADVLRTEQALTAGLLGAADWQSPTFGHAILSAAGRQDGRIAAHWNDYKRDRHLDAEEYERRYVEALVDGPPGLRALLTACGMAAFTTVLSWLLLERRLDGPVVAGAGLYHETRLLLERALPGRVRLVDERDTGALPRAIDDLRPSAVFLDSLSNTAWMPVSRLEHVLAHVAGRDLPVVVDNTGLSVSCQPFALAPASVRLIVFESLLKYAQLGMDRANAGVIVAHEEDAAALAHYREHLGTNVADVAVHALPRPGRAVLERRLARLQRNALVLAGRLRRGRPPVSIVYPRGPLPFRGGCLSLVFRESDRALTRERALVEAALAHAARRGVSLHAGSSFGFDVTRIYLTAARAEYGTPFVRVAAGTEHRLAVERVADALAAALREVAP